MLWLTPFALYIIIFLVLPTTLAVATGFFTKDGTITGANLAGLFDPTVLSTFASSFWVSAVTAIVGAVVGALLCYALLGMRPDGALRTIVSSASSVLAQFGGIMLAFAFIATIGIQGLVTVTLRDRFGIDIFENGVWLYQVPGLVISASTFRCRSW